MENTHMGNRANLYHYVLIQVNKYMLQIVYDEVNHCQEEVWRGRNFKAEQHQESAKISGRCKKIIFKRVQDFYIFTKSCSHICSLCKHQLMLLSDSLTLTKMGTCWKFSPMASLWFMTNATGNITANQKMK